jgi:crotonobetainyl-CoA:carnitine CoA-transferase CaiB-like acyl-CoA transferase
LTPDHELTPDKDDAGSCPPAGIRVVEIGIAMAGPWPLLNLSSADKRGIVFGTDLVSRPAAAQAGPNPQAHWAAPAMGEHTREVLRDVAGLSAPAIGDARRWDRLSDVRS